MPGKKFLHGLLVLDPRERLTPAQARDHPWLAAQAAKERVRIVEHELSRRSVASQTEPRKPKKRPRVPTEGFMANTDAGPSRAGVKRKASLLGLDSSLSSLSVSDDEKPRAKRARGEEREQGSEETIVPRSYRASAPPLVVWTNEDLHPDEIPGLGAQSGSSP